MPAPKTIKCYCSKCRRNTNQEVLFSVIEHSEDEDYLWQATYSVVKCKGCEAIQFHREVIDEAEFEYLPDGNVEPHPLVITYPARKLKVPMVESTYNLPSGVRNLYVETMDCLNNDRLQLAAAGFRAIIDAICRDVNITGRNLEVMINNLAKSHIITASDRDHLHAIRFMGNDSIHSLKKYTEKEVVIVAHIINAMLTSLYLIAKEVEDLAVKPVRTFDEFEEILSQRLSQRAVGDIDILRNFIKGERRIISEDLPKFETELQSRITAGTYTKLSLNGTPAANHSQSYKIETP